MKKHAMGFVLGTALAAAGLLLAAGPSADAEPDWHKLGDRYVGHAVDRDEIDVGAKKGRFDAIKLTVRRRAVRFRDVRVHFGNGDVQDVPLRRRIEAGGETRVIRLDGEEKRVIDKVVFWYDTAGRPRRGKVQAEVVLWGRK